MVIVSPAFSQDQRIQRIPSDNAFAIQLSPTATSHNLILPEQCSNGIDYKEQPGMLENAVFAGSL